MWRDCYVALCHCAVCVWDMSCTCVGKEGTWNPIPKFLFQEAFDQDMWPKFSLQLTAACKTMHTLEAVSKHLLITICTVKHCRVVLIIRKLKFLWNVEWHLLHLLPSKALVAHKLFRVAAHNLSVSRAASLWSMGIKDSLHKPETP